MLRRRLQHALTRAIRRAAGVAFVWGTALALLYPAALSSAGRKFYDDDPIARVPETQDASKAVAWDIEFVSDLLLNLFVHPGDKTPGVRAGDINTIDEVPDSSWFTNRILSRPMSPEEVARGPVSGPPPVQGKWTIVRAKAAGASPGFTLEDARGETWFASFDARGHADAATGAVVVANKLFWALGYWQAENFITSVRREDLAIRKGVTVRVPNGHRRPMKQSDVDAVLRLANQSADGTYRMVVARQLPGRALGGFKYFGVRSDDPNDLVPHEHRRVLRALKVFGAWTNLTDMKASNTLDTVVVEGGHGVIRHYLQDVGSTFGTGALGPRDWDDGWEYLFEGSTLAKRLVTGGLYIQPWQTVDYDTPAAIGRFEGKVFDPTTWKPHSPPAAFLSARADDNFWAARRVAAFTDDMIRAAARTGEYHDDTAADALADVLIRRRDKIARTYLTAVNPLVDFALDQSGVLTFTNAAAAAHVADEPADGYQATWASFDNSTGEVRPIGSPVSGTSGRIQAPSGLPAATGAYVKVQVGTVKPAIAAWATPIDVYFRKTAEGWKLVGLER
jgi:hypothetical protein